MEGDPATRRRNTGDTIAAIASPNFAWDPIPNPGSPLGIRGSLGRWFGWVGVLEILGILGLGWMNPGSLLAQDSPQPNLSPLEPPLGSTEPSPGESGLFLAYPPDQHTTDAAQIFWIGTADPKVDVRINGQTVGDRSPAGHFAPSFPLAVGENVFTLQAGNDVITRTIFRKDSQPPLPPGVGFQEGSLVPQVALGREPGEWICFGAIALPGATVSVEVGGRSIALNPSAAASLPSNAAVLLRDPNQLQPPSSPSPGPTLPMSYQGCAPFPTVGTFQPRFHLSHGGQTWHQDSPESITIGDPETLTVVEVTAPQGTARTGPSTDYSRLTPLPQGTQARVTGREGEWLRLDYGAGNAAWMKASETRILPQAPWPQGVIRGALARSRPGWTDLIFPLSVPVPVTVEQTADRLRLTLHNTTAQTDTVYIGADALVERVDWHQPQPQQVVYTIQFRTPQQWGYTASYEGNQLILSLKHPPDRSAGAKSLQGVHVFLDPGHGSAEDLGARGPTGYPEKDVALKVTQRLQQILEARGARVTLGRHGDEDLWPQDRVDRMATAQPDVALSLHYNALPDGGDALGTQGIGAFWYQPQAQDLAQFLHDYLVDRLDRPSYGVFWNNLALTRPSFTPAVLLELGFMINPQEFEWIMDPAAQEDLALALADGLALWFDRADP
jgi:N-acetylmuramoyl-L-alanine amidase